MSGTTHARGLAIVLASYGIGAVWLGLRLWPTAPGETIDMPSAALIAFVLPTTATVLLWAFSAISSRQRGETDPGEDVATDRILLRCIVFIAAMHVLIVLKLSAMSWMLASAPRLPLVLFGVLLVSIGNLLPTTRPNFLIGIRTSRALRCRALWIEIHRIGGYAAVALGLVVIVAALGLYDHAAGQVITVALLGAGAVVTARYRRLSRDHQATYRS